MPISKTDVANRACQKVGAELIDPGAILTEDSKQAQQILACYDTVRRSEMRRNVWRFTIRTTALRAIDMNSKLATFGTYAAGTTYAINDVVTGDDGQIYFSLVAANIGNTPSTSATKWRLYFGPDMATEFVTTWGAGFTYAKGDSTVGSNGTVYTSKADANINFNPVTDGGVHWSISIQVGPTPPVVATKMSFYSGELVHIGGTVYISLQNNNGDGNTVAGDGLPPPSASWLSLTTQPTIALLNFIYPIGASPSNASNDLKNVFRLPVGFLREAPQDPKAGQAQFLGAPDGSTFNDWNFESNYFTSDDTGPIPFRFAADVQDPNLFDPMFVEGFACRIGVEVCEPLTQSISKITECEKQYKVFMGEARTVNGIENGPVYPPEDSYITCRN